VCLSVRYHGAKAQGTASWQEASVSQAEQQAASTAVTDVAPQCPKCGADLSNDETYARYRVCGACGHHFTLSADERIRLLVDPGSFQEFNRHLVSVDPLVFSDRLPYRKRILQAREQTGLREAVVTGIARIRGHEVVLAVLDFRFLGGSMGSVVGEKITLAFERAAERRLPIITVAASGGARMQEGILSLVQMAKTTAAAKRAHDSNVPYISVLTHPTTGGIYASFANQGDIILAEPGALIGFAGPRVVKETAHTEPVRSHSAEFLLEHGFVDQVVDRRRLRDTIALILRLLQARAELPERTTASPIPQERPTRGRGRLSSLRVDQIAPPRLTIFAELARNSLNSTVTASMAMTRLLSAGLAKLLAMASSSLAMSEVMVTQSVGMGKHCRKATARQSVSLRSRPDYVFPFLRSLIHRVLTWVKVLKSGELQVRLANQLRR